MTTLANLKLIAAKRPAQISPVQMRRNKVSNRLWEQIQLAKAKQEGKVYAPTKTRTLTDKETGERKTMEVTKRMKEWWFIANDGKFCVSVKYGAKVIELAKGKTAVELAKADDLVQTLELLKKAVEEGELDTQIDAVCGAVKLGFKK
ncbi:DUF6641 family protein [Undibacterium sp. Dicai25W]|uniref:DUF6641 family protein n=1 Tax=Undibacterium sp. Dicai25W TaxID=3413034 RepID=UPI003BF4407C